MFNVLLDKIILYINIFGLEVRNRIVCKGNAALVVSKNNCCSN